MAPRPPKVGNLRHRRRFPQPTLYYDSDSVFLSEGLAVHYTKFSELLEAIERVPNADGDEGYRANAAGVTGNHKVPGRRRSLCFVK